MQNQTTTTSDYLAGDDDMLDVIAVGKELGGPDRPLHPATVFRLRKKRLIPEPIRIGARIVRWRRGDIRKIKQQRAS